MCSLIQDTSKLVSDIQNQLKQQFANDLATVKKNSEDQVHSIDGKLTEEVSVLDSKLAALSEELHSVQERLGPTKQGHKKKVTDPGKSTPK